MRHEIISQVLDRSDTSKQDSDFTYFFALLLAGEALTKTVTAGMISAIGDDKEKHRYRLEHTLVRADGLGDWGRCLDDALTGAASQFLIPEARTEQSDLLKPSKEGEWQHACVSSLKSALDAIGVASDPIPIKTDMKRWFRLFATLRNGTRGHGATLATKAGKASEHLQTSITQFYQNFSLFSRQWAYLHRNLAGHYRVSAITPKVSSFDLLKKTTDRHLQSGIYVFFDQPRLVGLIASDAELQDFHFPNGGFGPKKFELLSYSTDNKIDGDSSRYMTPVGSLPKSESEGHGELLAKGNCFTNVPDIIRDYVNRPKLEGDLNLLLVDDKRPIVTLVGRGGIGKTSLALRVIPELYETNRYSAIIWLSARDVDLQLSGPKPVRPNVLSPEDMGSLYTSLVLPVERAKEKGFSARAFFEKQLQACDIGPCLFVFDNFETTNNPVEMFNWIDSYIRLPNKALITTRLRDFKGDYPLEVQGMDPAEAKILIQNTAVSLKISGLLNESYIDSLIELSEGHPYIIKILLGEIAKEGKAASIPRLVAGSDDILTALFERTYVSLSPCAQRAFLTLSAWSSSVPRLALEAVLIQSTQQRSEIEKGIETLLQFSMAETQVSVADQQDFISLPLVASVFGRKKLNISPFKSAIQADVEILQMLGPSKRADTQNGLSIRLESFIRNISRRMESGSTFENFAPVLEMICRSYNAGWLIVARWHMEGRTTLGYQKAKDDITRFLENDSTSPTAAEAWRMLGHVCYKLGDNLGEIHAFVERAQISIVPFNDISSTANRLNELLRHGLFAREQKTALAARILTVMDRRKSQATADDFSRMAWLAIHLENYDRAQEFVDQGLSLDPENPHCANLVIKKFGR